MAGSLEALLILFLLTAPAPAPDAPREVAQTSAEHDREAEYKQRIDEAKTPEEEARIQAEHERSKQGDKLDNSDPPNVVPDTSGGHSTPKRDGGPRPKPPATH